MALKRIDFEDATIVKDAYVNINGVEYTLIPAQTSGGKDLNKETFDELQDNIENAISEIVESGNDGRKYWVKYSNGILVQWGYISWAWLPFTATGALYQTDELTVDLPVAFVGDLSDTCTNLISAAESGVYWNKSSFLKNASTIGGYFFKTVSGNADIYARYFAIGKWK